jgi:hypothetical protein
MKPYHDRQICVLRPEEGLPSVIAMPIQSAGILLYRKRRQSIEVFLIHPGGPFWKNKDAGAWSIPKGIVGPLSTS